MPYVGWGLVSPFCIRETRGGGWVYTIKFIMWRWEGAANVHLAIYIVNDWGGTYV
jgi:hypothetical protein